MDDALFMRGFKRVSDLFGDRERIRQWNGATRDVRGQVLSLDQFHDECIRFDAVDLRDVRVVQRREHLPFALEARDAIGVGRERLGQNLQRDVAIEVRVFRAIDLTHPASAEGGRDFVRSES